MPGRPKVLAIIFISINVLSIATLVAMAVVISCNPLILSKVFKYIGVGDKAYPHLAYDPYIWLALVPVEFMTFVINVILAWNSYREWARAATQLPPLKKTILRDNILYLSA